MKKEKEKGAVLVAGPSGAMASFDELGVARCAAIATNCFVLLQDCCDPSGHGFYYRAKRHKRSFCSAILTTLARTCTARPPRLVSRWLCVACGTMGIRRPTEIQRLAIPAIIKGQDVIARAKTGSGKTAAFGLPILHELSQDPYGIFAYVLTPTRELAYQIAEQFRAFGAPMSARVQVVIGGTDIVEEGMLLSKSPHVVVATPGRLAAHTRDGGHDFNLKHLRYLVLDEADRLLDASFADDLSSIVASLPDSKRRQTLLFSATLTEQIKTRAASYCKDPVYLQVGGVDETHTVQKLDQSYLFIPQTLKETFLIHLLQKFEKKSAIVFTSTCRGCEVISQLLVELEIPAESLHSRKNQARRLASLAKFKGGLARILVATDVASRGLDIPQVELVVNYDVPRVCEDYVHRVGRTARAGRGGSAVTLVSQYDIRLFKAIEEHVHVKIPEFKGVKQNDALELLKTVSAAKKMAKMRIEEFDLADEGRKYRRRVKRNSGRNSVGDSSGNSGGNGGGNGGDGAVQTGKVETGAGTTRNGTTRKGQAGTKRSNTFGPKPGKRKKSRKGIEQI